jgi:hypothetical protein
MNKVRLSEPKALMTERGVYESPHIGAREDLGRDGSSPPAGQQDSKAES